MSLFTFLRDLFIMDRLFGGHRDNHERDLNHNYERDHNHKQKQKNNHHNKHKNDKLPVMYMNNMKSYGNGRRRGDIVDDDLDEDMAYDLVDDLFDD